MEGGQEVSGPSQGQRSVAKLPVKYELFMGQSQGGWPQMGRPASSRLEATLGGFQVHTLTCKVPASLTALPGQGRCRSECGRTWGLGWQVEGPLLPADHKAPTLSQDGPWGSGRSSPAVSERAHRHPPPAGSPPGPPSRTTRRHRPRSRCSGCSETLKAVAAH